MKYILLLLIIFSFFLPTDFIDLPHYTTDQVMAEAKKFNPTCEVVSCG